jgi:hypothetical protein
MKNVLMHHGVKGQKWGVRHDTNNYSQKQFNRDKGVYGLATAKRFRKKMQDQNQSIQGLRSKEAERIAGFRKAAKIGGVVGAVGGAVGGYFAGKAFEEHGVKPLTNKMDSESFKMFYSGISKNQKTSRIIGVGSEALKTISDIGFFKYGTAAVGAFASKPATEAAIMAIGGYSPRKLKDDGGY